MKKRLLMIFAVCALFIALCSCTTANRNRTAVNPAPTHTPKTYQAPAARPAMPRTAAPRHRITPRAQPTPDASRFNGQTDGFRHDGFRQDGYRGGMDGRDGYRSGSVQDGYRSGLNTNRSGANDGMYRGRTAAGRDGYRDGRTMAPRTAAPRFRAAPPVRSIPRANRIPATRIPVR